MIVERNLKDEMNEGIAARETSVDPQRTKECITRARTATPRECIFLRIFLSPRPLLPFPLKTPPSLPAPRHLVFTLSRPQLPLCPAAHHQCSGPPRAAAQEQVTMVKKLAFTSLFFNSSETLSSSTSMSASFSTAASWQWPSCTQAKTLSFRRDSSPEIVSMRQDSTRKHDEEEFKTTMNPAYGLDDCRYSASILSDSSTILSTAPEPEPVVVDEDEVIIHGLRSSNSCRLLFEPDSTSSIVKKKEEKKKRRGAAAAFDGATALAIESADPYGDFRRSMEEMVLSHGVNDWGWLEEMLAWYLRANGKKTHGLIVGAFVDLLVALASSSAPSPSICSKKGKQSDDDCSSGPMHYVCN